MKNITIGFLFLAAILFGGCEKSIESFDNNTNYIYFNMPFKTDQYGRQTTERMDSLTYSFALDDISVTSYTFKIPVSIVGLPAGEDRGYEIEVDQTHSSASESDWQSTTISNLTIAKGAMHDTILLTVNRTPVLKTMWRSLTLNIKANSHFELGASDLLSAKVAFTDILQPPSWWSIPGWLNAFGEFSREKYVKWQEIYYLGADPNLEPYGPDTGKQLYWGQMPYYAGFASWYPSTYMFIAKLKQYFIDNEVYPDGDTSKPRITLP